MNKMLKYGLLAAGALGSMMAIGVGLAYFSTQPEKTTTTPGSSQDSLTTDGTITSAELAQNDGLNGNECYVAIDGTVYLVKGIAEWAMGKHTPADGNVTCGKDLTQDLQRSPHGAKVLQKLPVVGTLQN